MLHATLHLLAMHIYFTETHVLRCTYLNINFCVLTFTGVHRLHRLTAECRRCQYRVWLHLIVVCLEKDLRVRTLQIPFT
jgi:hypothetical protein